jgi:hypothetical protein
VSKVGRNRYRVLLFLVSVLAFLVPLSAASGQQANDGGWFIQITAGLGVSAHSDPTILDYINALTYPSPDQKLTGFTSASEFFITPEVQINDEWSVGLEYSYLVKSYNIVAGDPWNFSYNVQMPTLLVHYLVPGEGYWVKLGGGIGAAFGTLTENYVQTGAGESSTASGPGFKIEAVGNTKFDDHFWGRIGLDLRWVYAGSFKGGLVTSAPTPKLDFFSAGVKFGVTFQL